MCFFSVMCEDTVGGLIIINHCGASINFVIVAWNINLHQSSSYVAKIYM